MYIPVAELKWMLGKIFFFFINNIDNNIKKCNLEAWSIMYFLFLAFITFYLLPFYFLSSFFVLCDSK